MKIKNIVEEDFINYKIPSMFIIFPTCNFKCEKECGVRCCQNSGLALQKDIEVDISNIVERYMSNPITSAIVCGGMEPMDSWDSLLSLIALLRYRTADPIIIYTGYTEEEVKDKIEILKSYNNIIMKFGRFVPNQQSHYDEVLGVSLASDNQYGKVISLW